MKPNLNLKCCDCMELMARYPDNHFDLAIVDPPYGINFAKNYTTRTQDDKLGRRHKSKNWDDVIPNNDYFIELFRVSKNQIIWGANYFPFLWENGCRGFVFWYKENPVDNFSDGELAYTSFNTPAKCFHFRYSGCLEGKTNASKKIHPTQKPVKLYSWILQNYAKEGDKILDTHLGSGSIAIACHDLKYDLTGCEIDKDYFSSMLERVKIHQSQLSLF